jgi:anti-sigma regulatory factor (Ser/Thr protein kinase)
MIASRSIAVEDESQIGEARRIVAEACKRLGADETQAGQAAIAATELAGNLIRHAGRGFLLMQEFPRAPKFRLELTALDSGPGISNVGQALRDGFSTNGTPGTGLGSIRRMASRFDIYSQPSHGTVVWIRLGDDSASQETWEIGGLSVPMAGEVACGDSWDVLVEAGDLRLIVADGLGHGPFAEEASREAIAIFRKYPTSSPAAVMELAHLALGKTRGAAGAMVRISSTGKGVCGSGIGNISMRMFTDAGSKSLLSDNGTLGGRARRAQETQLPWIAGAILVMHSDGLGSQWNLADYPGLMSRHPGVLAGVLYRDFQRERDDTTVVVVKEKL